MIGMKWEFWGTRRRVFMTTAAVPGKCKTLCYLNGERFATFDNLYTGVVKYYYI